MIKADKITVTAHTGTMGTPMNSLEAIRKGIENGADIIEFDLNFTKDGTPVLSHNSPSGGEVLFEDALILLEKHSEVKINIDVKNTADLRLAESLIIKHGLLDRAFFTGINSGFVKAVKEQCSGIPYFLNVYRIPPLFGRKKFYAAIADEIKKSGAIGLNANLYLITRGLTEYLHSENLLVSGWTAKNKHQMRSLIKKGVDNITTKRPDIMRKILPKQ